MSSDAKSQQRQFAQFDRESWVTTEFTLPEGERGPICRDESNRRMETTSITEHVGPEGVERVFFGFYINEEDERLVTLAEDHATHLPLSKANATWVLGVTGAVK